MLKEPVETAKEWLRAFVGKNPTGWLDDPDVFKRYRFTRVGKLRVILQDSVSYLLEMTKAAKLFGLQQLFDLGILKVDNAKLLEAIENGLLKFIDSGEIVTYEDWETMRERKVNKAAVVVKEEDAVGDEHVIVIKPDLMSTPVDRLRELTSLTGHHIKPLAEAGITIVGQLRGWSLVDLIDIKNIGRKRGQEILAAVTGSLS